MPDLASIVVWNADGLSGLVDPMVLTLDELRRRGAELDSREPGLWAARLASRCSEDLAILIYTSGTTGRPKGAMLSHRNIISMIPPFIERVRMEEGDERISFLPLCHVAERVAGVYCSLYSGSVINFVEGPNTALDNLREIAPHSLNAVPRVWEKLYSAVTLRMAEATPFERWAYRASIAVGQRAAQASLTGTSLGMAARALVGISRALVLRNVRRWMGVDRCRILFSGAAPISPDLIMWFRCLGLEMVEGYGMTEISGIATCGEIGSFRPGTVGRPARGVEIALSDNGEILIRSPGVIQGYLNLPDATAEAIRDGWFRTGDVGAIEESGQLRITDRVKDIIINSAGKNISPSGIENALKFSPYVSDAMVIGDRRKYLTCLLMLDRENVEKYAQDNSVPFHDFPSLCRAAPVVDLLAREVERVNASVARVEQIKKFQIIDRLLTAEDEEMTPTMKLKRRVVAVKYADLIERMYAEDGIEVVR